jgi:hypothetical protein
MGVVCRVILSGLNRERGPIGLPSGLPIATAGKTGRGCRHLAFSGAGEVAFRKRFATLMK